MVFLFFESAFTMLGRSGAINHFCGSSGSRDVKSRETIKYKMKTYILKFGRVHKATIGGKTDLKINCP